jgi:hypothetical protein
MPTLHRLATLRDDVIFFVYLYQSWAYKVDFNRVNEFGQGGDDEEEEEKAADKPLVAAPEADGSVKVEGKSPAKEIEAEVERKAEVVKASGMEKGQVVKRK